MGAKSRRFLALLGLAMLVALLPPSDARAGHNGPLVGQWSLDGLNLLGDTPTTPDSSGHGLTGFANAVELTDGRFSLGLLFGQDASVTVGASEQLEPARITVVAWVQSIGTPGSVRTVLAKGGDSNDCSASSWALDTGDGGGIEFYVRGPSGSARFDSPEASQEQVWDGEWHAVAGSYDGTTVRLYVDGQQVGTGQAGPPSIRYDLPNRSFAMAQYPACDGFAYGERLDEVQVYDRALTATEITGLHNPAATTPPVIGPPGEPPPPPPDAAPSARFSAIGRLGALGSVVLDARATTGATSLRWDVTGDGSTDVICASSEPALRLTTTSAATRSVTLTAVGARGATSSSAVQVVGGGRTLGKRVRRSVFDSAVCAADPNRFLTPPRDDSCVEQTVMFGLVEAAGCFTRVQDPSGIPSAEAATIRRYYDSPEYPSYVVTICRAAQTERQRQACETLKSPYETLDFYVSRGPVRLNGITFTPSAGASIAVFPNLNRVISSRATLRWGGMTVKSAGPVNFNVRSNTLTLGKRRTGASGTVYLLDFDGKRDLPSIAGFRLDGLVTLSLRGINGERMSEGRLRLSLPPPFSALGGKAPSGEVALLASNRGGPTISSLSMGVPEARLGPVRISDLSFRYELNGGIDGDRNPGTSCNKDEWKARGNIYLAGGSGGEGGFKLTPPPEQNGLGFCDGGFKHFGGDLIFGGPIPRPQIFPGVFLNSIGFNIGLNPTILRGRGVMSVADLSTVDGELVMIFASPSQPFSFGGQRLTATTVSASGSLGVNLPVVGRIPIGRGSLLYSYPDYFSFSGTGSIILPGMSLDGTLGGAARVSQNVFSIHGGVTACLAGIRGGLCAGADAWVTSIGAVACLNIGPLHPGAGVRWSSMSFSIWPLDGCKPSQYWPTISSRASQANIRNFRVARGEAIKYVKLEGRGGAPRIRLSGPGGRSLEAANEEFATDSGRTMQVIPHEASDATFIGVKGAGRYRIETLQGSVQITSMSASRPGFDTDFNARVTGRGRSRTLVYDARRAGGQRVTFVEVGRNVFRPITTVRGGRGRIRFSLAPGSAGRRTIVAQATLDGVPIPDQLLSRFNAPGVRKTGRPRGVRVRRRSGALAVRWSPVTAARRYGVVVELTNGSERQFLVNRHRRSLLVRGVGPTQGGIVRVSAQGLMNDFGKPASARFRRLRAAPSALVTTHENPRKRRRRG